MVPPISLLQALSVMACINDGSGGAETSQAVLSSVTQVTARQLYPTCYDTERSAHKFCAGMSLRLSVRAEFTGIDISVDQCDRVTVRTPVAVVVNRPDGKSSHWQPPNHCWSASKQKDSSKMFFLDTEVPLSFNEWSEAGQVHLGLAVLLPDNDVIWKLTEPVGVKIYPIAANKCL